MTDTHNTTPGSAASVAHEAADWYARLRAPDVSEIEAVRFRAWLAADPVRRREFDAIDTFWGDLSAIEHSPEVERVCEVIAARQRKRRRGQGYLAMAATLVVGLGGVWAGWQHWGAGRYETRIGEQRMVPLADGSMVTLNTATEIRIHYSETERAIELIRGQANFDVAKDADRPFIVTAGGGTVRALGTVFDVYKTAHKVTVTLIDGKVAVTPNLSLRAPKADEPVGEVTVRAVVLDVGEQVSFATDAPVAKVPEVIQLASVEVPRVSAWKARKLDFNDTPVLEAIAEANRYSQEQIVLDAPELTDARISGTFETGKNEAFVDGLRAYFRLEAHRSGDHTIVLTRRPE